MAAIACATGAKRGEQNRHELAAVATGIDLRFRRHVFRRPFSLVVPSHCLLPWWLLPSPYSLPPLCSFLRKRSPRSEHMPNRRLVGRPRRNLLPGRKSPRGLSMEGPGNRGGILCTCRPRNRDHEILTSVRRPAFLSPPFARALFFSLPLRSRYLAVSLSFSHSLDSRLVRAK